MKLPAIIDILEARNRTYIVLIFKYRVIPFSYFHFSKLPLSPSSRGGIVGSGGSAGGVGVPSFSRNVPERSTFHSGMKHNSRAAKSVGSGGYGLPTSSQDTSSINPATRPSNFFSKLSSKFSKRYDQQ